MGTTADSAKRNQFKYDYLDMVNWKTLLPALILSMIVSLSASADPGTKLGKSLAAVQSEVDGLRHLRNWPSQGDQYIVYHEINVYTSYYFRNNQVVKEEFTCSGDENTAEYYFNRFVSDFGNQNYNRVSEGQNSVTFYFSRMKVIVSISHFVGNEYLCKVTYTR